MVAVVKWYAATMKLNFGVEAPLDEASTKMLSVTLILK